MFPCGTGQDTVRRFTATPDPGCLGKKTVPWSFFRDSFQEAAGRRCNLIQAERCSSIGVLATGIAHEINNPMQIVAGYASELRSVPRDPALGKNTELEVFPQYLGVIVPKPTLQGHHRSIARFCRKSDGIAVDVDLNALLPEVTDCCGTIRTIASQHGPPTSVRSLPHVLADPSGLARFS